MTDQFRSLLARASLLNWRPPLAFIIPLLPGDHGLVGKQLRGLMREFCADDGCHQRMCCQVVVLQAVLAPSNCPGSAREGLVVEPRVGDRPVQVSPGRGLPPELAAVADPPLSLIVPLRPGDHANSSRALEFGAYGRCHQGEALNPLRDVSNGWAGGYRCGGLVCGVGQCRSIPPPSPQTRGPADA